LQKLDLYNTRVTDAGIKELKELKNLRLLDVRRTKVSEAALTELKAVLPAIEIQQ
jgi:hypothetical protein